MSIINEMSPRLKRILSRRFIINPNVRPNNFGLESYNQAFFDGVEHLCSIVPHEDNNGNFIKYITGLDENDVSVLSLPVDERKEKILEIREIVAYYLRIKDGLVLDINAPDFWVGNPLDPKNRQFWEQPVFRFWLSSRPYIYYLNDLSHPEYVLIYYAIKAGGYPLISPSKDLLKEQRWLGASFYLEDEEEKKASELVKKKTLSKAISVLQKLYDDGEVNKMYYSYIMLNPSNNYIDGKDIDYIYSQLYNNLEKGSQSYGNNLELCDVFISYSRQNTKELGLKALVKKLLVVGRIIYREADKSYFSLDLGSTVGTTEDNIIKFLSSVQGKQDLGVLIRSVKENYGLDFDSLLSPIKSSDEVTEDTSSKEVSSNTDSILKNKIKK